MGERTTKLCDYTKTPNDQFIARPITNPETKAGSFEVNPGLLNLIAKEQFGEVLVKMHLHDFVKFVTCKKLRVGKMILLNLNYSHSHLEANPWLLALLTGSINSWDNLKEAFIKNIICC